MNNDKSIPLADAHVLVRDPANGPMLNPLTPGEVLSLGRAPGNTIVLHDERASRNHAEIRVNDDGKWVIHDLKSRNGTTVGANEITSEHTLIDGDTIQIGSITILYCEGPPPSLSEADESDTDGTGITGEMSAEIAEWHSTIRYRRNRSRLLDDIRKEVTSAVDEKSDCGLSKDEGEQWFPVFGGLCNRAESYYELWMFYAKEQKEGASPNARWLVYKEYENQADILLFGSPLSTGEVLYHSLWKNVYGSVLTSATLTALGRFDRLAQKGGLPSGSGYHKVVSPFDFPNVASLSIPKMSSEASNPAAHTEEICARFEELIGEHQAVLVLFSSRKQMNDVFYGIARDIREDVMTQDDMSKIELMNAHRETIDQGKRSILFGLASMAEGIDLPGNYLTHVMIAKIPFSVPNDPLEESISEWLELQGRNPFMEVSVPDASLKLIQACGRLIRTESDKGKVTILDSRLLTRRYGGMLINALPPYRREF